MLQRATLLLVVLAGCQSRPAAWNGTLLDPPVEIDDFTLQSADGDVSKASFAGSYTALVFGYTHCPDFCPATMARMAKTVALLGQNAAAFRVALVTVDPDRDTPEKLRDYARSFHPDFIGLTGSREQLEALTKRIGIFSERAHTGDHDEAHDYDYLVNHTTSVVLLDPQGRMRLIWSFELSPEAMAADLRQLTG